MAAKFVRYGIVVRTGGDDRLVLAEPEWTLRDVIREAEAWTAKNRMDWGVPPGDPQDEVLVIALYRDFVTEDPYRSPDGPAAGNEVR